MVSSDKISPADNPELIRRRFPPVPGELVEFIKKGQRFIIAGHKEPDGDCVGSQLALRNALVRIGKEAIVCSAGPFNRTELKKYNNQFISDSVDDLVRANNWTEGISVIIVDCSNIERVGDIKNDLEKYPLAIIDHHASRNHPESTPEAPVYVDPDAPACTILIHKLITALGLKMTKEEATLLLFGLCTDTGFFRHLTEKNSDVFEAAAKMIRYGASPKKIFRITNGGKSLESRILMGRILSRSELFYDGRLLVSHETLEEYNSFGLKSRDSDHLNQMLMSIEGVEATITIRQERADNCTVSLRSIDKVNVSQIASSFGGGGHKNAAGLTMKGDISHVKQVMLDSFKDIFVR
ncbi:MAG: bifunctional oligoribonuclease/PAP phosphatase NrnA [Treponema sp.]|jgi:phosphoesterase RecJ-like protein|nr:bifunctional oligoribonuclease/PAP phosphatase NrnA [Treponema sp.]